MPNTVARETARGRRSPNTRCICSFETKAWTAPDKANPRTSAHRVAQNMKKPSRRLSRTSFIASGPHEPGDGGLGLGDLGVGIRPTPGHCLAYAMVEVVVEQLQSYGLQGLGSGRDLCEDIDAVGVLV